MSGYIVARWQGSMSSIQCRLAQHVPAIGRAAIEAVELLILFRLLNLRINLTGIGNPDKVKQIDALCNK
jgi:hypothetical protein